MHYHNRRPRALDGLVFFGFCALFFYEKAATNTRGLLIDGLIHLDPAQATTFWWVCFVVSLGMTLLGLVVLIMRAFSKPGA